MNRLSRQVFSLMLVICVCLTMLPNVVMRADAATTFYWPLSTSYPITTGYTAYANHNGVDMAAPQGTPLYATFSGTAVYYQAYTTINGKNYLTSYGNHVWVTSTSGTYKAVYAHLNAFEGFGLTIPSSQTKRQSGNTGKITIGSRNVQEGDLLGYVGTTGNSTGNHLHFGLQINGSYVNPTNYLNSSKCAGNASSSGGTTTSRTADSRFNGKLPIHAYPISTGNISVYDANGVAYSKRYITGSTDLCIIQEIYTDGWCQVKYPSSAESSGYFTAYVKLSEFISNASPTSWTAGANATVYSRATGSNTIGSISTGDSCFKVSGSNGRIQIIYPVNGKGYYKMGWVNEGNGNSGNTGVSAPNYLLPCYSYTISTGQISVYDANHNKYSNRHITGSSDQCIIREIYTDGWCYVSYPSSVESDGWFEAYVPLGEFVSNANPVSWTATGGYTAYQRSSGSQTIGSITAGDSCVVVSEANGRMQVMYPVSGTNYYKMGWIDASLANNPQGMVDSVDTGIYTVNVRGWAFDRDDTSAPLKIHVYIGGVAYEITANTERPDVHNVYGCGNYHGYDETIFVDRSLAGTQNIEIYAINVGSGTNILLGSRSIKIGSDTTAPVISNVSVTEVSSDGYTVTCTVTDENGIDRVQFPTWTSNNGQDDLFADWTVNNAASGTRNGNTFTYKVYTSAHNYESGEYTTHIYAYDLYGNSTCYSVPSVQVPIDVISVDFECQEIEFGNLGETKTLVAYINPENATDQTLAWASSDVSVATVKNGVVAATGAGTAVITATAANGAFAECKVTVAIPTKYSVTYNANGGTGAPEAQTKNHNVSIILSDIEPTRAGYTFLGWSTNRNALVAEYPAGDIFSVNADTTLYAVWLKAFVTKLEITEQPAKNTYEIGEELDLTGMVLQATYSDGTTKIVEDGFLSSGFDSDSAGVKTITVSYSSVSTTFTVVVEEKEIVDPNAPQIIVNSIKGREGATVSVAISLKNNPGIASMRLKVDYDSSALSLVGVNDLGELGSQLHSDQYTDPYVLCWANDTVTQNFTYNGDIVVLTFKVNDDAAIGTYDICISYDYDKYDIHNVQVQKVKFYTVDGVIEVVDVLPGDANGDGSVDTLDRLTLSRYLANWKGYTLDQLNFAGADVNSDGSVDTLDRLILSRHLANWSGYEDITNPPT